MAKLASVELPQPPWSKSDSIQPDTAAWRVTVRLMAGCATGCQKQSPDSTAAYGRHTIATVAENASFDTEHALCLCAR